MKQQVTLNKIIFWSIVLTSIAITFIVYSLVLSYQALDKQAQATAVAVPTLTVEALEFSYQKGLGYMNLGRWPEAKREMELVFEVDPNYRDVQVRLSEIYSQLSDNKLTNSSPEMMTPTVLAGCGWIDDQDNKATEGDKERGISDWNNHYSHIVNSPKGISDSANFIASRMMTLSQCLNKTTYAEAYADVSVTLAQYGRDKCRWFDGQDPRLARDQGRGVSSWNDHYHYVMARAIRLSDPADFVVSRVVTLGECLSRADYGSAYADISVMLAEYGRNH
jgi:hypothetical protein